MAYTDHFKLADDIIAHLNTVMGEVTDPLITSRYAGFAAVVSVTVYELAIKEIFVGFGERKHKVLGEFTRSYFNRINGRIAMDTIKRDYIAKFGDKYVQRFKRKIDEVESNSLREHSISVKTSYGNVITWRNQFAHEGILPSTATYDEVTRSYQTGKDVIKCLAETMQR